MGVKWRTEHLEEAKFIYLATKHSEECIYHILRAFSISLGCLALCLK